MITCKVCGKADPDTYSIVKSIIAALIVEPKMGCVGMQRWCCKTHVMKSASKKE